MPRFFADINNVGEDSLVIDGGDAVHIGRSLRMRLGDEITVCCQGMEYQCEILRISDESVECKIITKYKGNTEPNIDLTLFQALPKSDKMDFIVQKAVELGANKIVPVLTERCVSRPNAKSFEKKLERFNKIALEAAKQCGRCIVPEVCSMVDFDKAVEMLLQTDCPLICYEKGGKNLSQAGLSQGISVGVFIGSEGGFEPSEAEKCIDNGITPIGLGSRILRCETAPVAAISIIMNLTGNM